MFDLPQLRSEDEDWQDEDDDGQDEDDDGQDEDDDWQDEDDDCQDEDDDGQDEDDDWHNEDDDCQDEDDDCQDEDDQSHEEVNRLQRDLQRLSNHFSLWLDNDYRFVIIQGVRLPPGYNYDETDFFLEIPADYPCSPPGIGDSQVYVSPHLRYWKQSLTDVHPCKTPKYEVGGF